MNLTRRHLILSVILTASMYGAAATQAGEPIKIGAVGPLSGPTANIGINMREGFNYVAKQINDAGGITIDGNKRLVQFLYEDSQGRPEVGVSAAQKLLSRDNVDILIGDTVHSSVALAIMELAPSYKDKLFLTGQVTSTEIARKIENGKGRYENFWKTLFNGDAYASTIQGAVKWLHDGGKLPNQATTVAFVGEDTDFGRGITDETAKLFKEMGWTVTASEIVDFQQADFYPQLSKLRANPPAVIVSTISANNSGVALAKQLREKGIKSTHLGVYYPSQPAFVRDAGEAANGTLFTPLMLDTVNNQSHKEFVKMLSGYVRDDVTLDHALAVCTAGMLMDNLKKAGTLKIDKLNKAFYDTDYNCVLGKLKFDPASHSPIVGPDYFVIPVAQIQDGVAYVIWPPKNATSSFR